LRVVIAKAHGLAHIGMTGEAIHCTCEVLHPHTGESVVHKTTTSRNTQSPVWYQSFEFSHYDPGETVVFCLRDEATGKCAQTSLPSDHFYPAGCEMELRLGDNSDAALLVFVSPDSVRSQAAAAVAASPAALKAMSAPDEKCTATTVAPGGLKVMILQAAGLQHLNMSGESTSCTCETRHPHTGDSVLKETSQARNSSSPAWNQTLEFSHYEPGQSLVFSIRDDVTGKHAQTLLLADHFYPHGCESELWLDEAHDATLLVKAWPSIARMPGAHWGARMQEAGAKHQKTREISMTEEPTVIDRDRGTYGYNLHDMERPAPQAAVEILPQSVQAASMTSLFNSAADAQSEALTSFNIVQDSLSTDAPSEALTSLNSVAEAPQQEPAAANSFSPADGDSSDQDTIEEFFIGSPLPADSPGQQSADRAAGGHCIQNNTLAAIAPLPDVLVKAAITTASRITNVGFLPVANSNVEPPLQPVAAPAVESQRRHVVPALPPLPASVEAHPTSEVGLRLLPAVPDECRISDDEIALLTSARHPDVSRLLGPQLSHGKVVVRCWISGAKEMSLSSNALLPSSGPDAREDPPSKVPLQLVDRCPAECQWLFEAAFEIENGSGLLKDTQTLRAVWDYQLNVKYSGDAETILEDAYGLGPLLPAEFLADWSKGKLSAPPASMFGARHMELRPGIWGTRFAVWAPHAEAVSVVGDFNFWNARANPMCSRTQAGVWEIFHPVGDLRGQKYAYHITPKNGKPMIKTDPFAQEFVEPINGAHDAKVPQCDDYSRSAWSGSYEWNDSEWLARRAIDFGPDKWSSQPLSIYEVHLGSWTPSPNGTPQSYRELAEPLVAHVKEMSFTAVEFLPLSQYPCDQSWGYQCASGLYAVDSRLGTPDDFRFLVDTLHQNGIAVFIDFVAAHFAKDEWGLVSYSGAPQFEYAGALGELPGWGTARFDYSKPEVRAYLIGAAEFWIEQLHVDGLRLDAVAPMVYGSFGREEDGDAIMAGRGVINDDGVSFLKELCNVVRTRHPGVLVAAEESTNYKWVTSRPGEHGTERNDVKVEDLGFHLKWNMGFTYDTLAFMGTESVKRPQLETFGWQKLAWYSAYMFNERWVLPFSHDNSHHLGLLEQMTSSGEAESSDQSAQMRLLMSYIIGMPGRPLLFMGAEVGEGAWSHKTAIDWKAAEKDEQKSQLKRWVAKLMRLYKELPALHRQDDLSSSFAWIDKDTARRCVYCWKRTAIDASDVIVLVNAGTQQLRYTIPAGECAKQAWSCVARSDTPDAAESTVIPAGSHEFTVDLPPYTSQVWLAIDPSAQKSSAGEAAAKKATEEAAAKKATEDAAAKKAAEEAAAKKAADETAAKNAAEEAAAKKAAEEAAAEAAAVQSSSPTKVRFEVKHAETQQGEVVCLVGGCPELGAWQLPNALRLSTSAEQFPIWSAEVEFAPPRLKISLCAFSPSSGASSENIVEYKLVTLREDNFATWEAIEGNRQLNLSRKWQSLHLDYGKVC